MLNMLKILKLIIMLFFKINLQSEIFNDTTTIIKKYNTSVLLFKNFASDIYFQSVDETYDNELVLAEKQKLSDEMKSRYCLAQNSKDGWNLTINETDYFHAGTYMKDSKKQYLVIYNLEIRHANETHHNIQVNYTSPRNIDPHLYVNVTYQNGTTSQMEISCNKTNRKTCDNNLNNDALIICRRDIPPEYTCDYILSLDGCGEYEVHLESNGTDVVLEKESCPQTIPPAQRSSNTSSTLGIFVGAFLLVVILCFKYKERICLNFQRCRYGNNNTVKRSEQQSLNRDANDSKNGNKHRKTSHTE